MLNALPGMRSVYDSSALATAQAVEQARAGAMWTAAGVGGPASGVVPRPASASRFAAPVAPDGATPSFVASLTGEAVPAERFTHNNMTPYYSGATARQNTDPEAFATMFEYHTGAQPLLRAKQAVPSLFAPDEFGRQPFNMPNASEFLLSRINAPVTRNNAFPVEQVRVGPGLGAGYTAAPSGGQQQAATLDAVRPKNVDELRAANNPRIVHEAGAQGPGRATGVQRGITGAVSKNRPDNFFELASGLWGAAHAARPSAASDRAAQPVKPTARTGTEPAKPAQLTNATSLVKSVVAPLLDALRPTVKQTTEQGGRAFGTMARAIPEKPTVYDPVLYAPRTTMKETLVQESELRNFHGLEKPAPVDRDDVAKTTGRQTLAPFTEVRNVNGRVFRVTVYPEDRAKTTTKETTLAPYTPSAASTFKASSSREAAEHLEVDPTKELLIVKAAYTPNARPGSVSQTLDGQDLGFAVNRRLEQDALASRAAGNVTRVAAVPTTPVACEEVTKAPANLPDGSDRLDPAILNALRANPLHRPVGPYGTC